MTETASYVYFARRGDAVKIGRTTSLVGRMRSLECAHDADLRLIAAIPGGADVEAELHLRFRTLRIRGEWFMLTGELRDYVVTLPALTLPPKRGYSRDFTPRTDRRIKREIDRVPPTLDAKVQGKLGRLQAAGVNISLRSLTLTLWTRWADDELDDEGRRVRD